MDKPAGFRMRINTFLLFRHTTQITRATWNDFWKMFLNGVHVCVYLCQFCDNRYNTIVLIQVKVATGRSFVKSGSLFLPCVLEFVLVKDDSSKH